jgi:hypothetical protein
MSAEAGVISKVEVTLVAWNPLLLDNVHVIFETVLVQVQQVLVGTTAVIAGKLSLKRCKI